MANPPKALGPKNPKRQASGRRNVTQRADHQVATVQLSQDLIKKATPHVLKIDKYRDRLMAGLKGRVDTEMFLLVDKRSTEIRGSMPQNSEISLYSDLVLYVEFCQRIEARPLPFNENTTISYIGHLQGAGNKRETINRHVASLAKWAEYLELPDPRREFAVAIRLKRMRQELKGAQRQAEGLRVAHLERAVEILDPEVPRDCQDLTLLFIGFQTLCRESELVSFNWEDFSEESDGTGLMYLADSKTDKDGEGAYLALAKNTVDLLLGWQTVCGKKSGPIFRGIYSTGKLGDRLRPRGVHRCYQRVARRLGLNPKIFSGHSARVGAAQEMVENNIDVAKVMLSGRWQGLRMIVRYTKKIQAKRSGMAELSQRLGWNSPPSSDRRQELIAQSLFSNNDAES